MRLLVGSVVGGVLGFALGAWVFRTPAVVTVAEPVAPSPLAVAASPQRERSAPPTPAPVEHSGAPSETAAAPAPAAPAAAPPSAPGLLPPTLDAQARIAALEAEVRRLTALLEAREQDRLAAEGQALARPPGLPARLVDERALVTNFNAALKEAGFPGQVTNVDCAEYPCIVYGTGFGAKGDMERLQETGAFSAYAKDGAMTYGFQRGGSADERFFGVAMLPKGDEPSEALKKRVGFRVRQMEEVSRPPAAAGR